VQLPAPRIALLGVVELQDADAVLY